MPFFRGKLFATLKQVGIFKAMASDNFYETFLKGDFICNKNDGIKLKKKSVLIKREFSKAALGHLLHQ